VIALFVPSLTKNCFVVARFDVVAVGNIAVAVTPVNPSPLPKNDPLKEPLK